MCKIFDPMWNWVNPMSFGCYLVLVTQGGAYWPPRIADDMIMMSMSANGMQRCLDNLKSYCDKWQLKVSNKS